MMTLKAQNVRAILYVALLSPDRVLGGVPEHAADHFLVHGLVVHGEHVVPLLGPEGGPDRDRALHDPKSGTDLYV